MHFFLILEFCGKNSLRNVSPIRCLRVFNLFFFLGCNLPKIPRSNNNKSERTTGRQAGRKEIREVLSGRGEGARATYPPPPPLINAFFSQVHASHIYADVGNSAHEGIFRRGQSMHDQVFHCES